MNSCAVALLAALSVFDYPARQPRHEALRAQCVEAIAKGDADAMEKACAEGAELLPDDPTWAYNLACAYARQGRKSDALDALEKSVRLGFRDPEGISTDADLKAVADDPRFEDIVDTAERLRDKPLLLGPNAAVPALGRIGSPVVLGAHNLVWDLDAGCFNARMKLEPGDGGGNDGDLYFNRDGGHSVPNLARFPGVTPVSLDSEGKARGADLDAPNIAFPLPVFGNCSRALVEGPLWRSLPRALMTFDSPRLAQMQKFYLSNQTWVFPACYDCPPVGTNGDVFASIAPYWIATQGKSWSDKYYLEAALEASRSMGRAAKESAVSHGLLAPTIQTLIRKSLKGVADEDAYLGPEAHPTAFPTNGLDIARLKSLAAALEPQTIPPIAILATVAAGEASPDAPRELVYASLCAAAFVLRQDAEKRNFIVAAKGGDDYAFRAVRDPGGAATVKTVAPGVASISLETAKIPKGSRVDIAVFAKRGASGWGAPSYVCFHVPDPGAAYRDPVFDPPEAPAPVKPEGD